MKFIKCEEQRVERFSVYYMGECCLELSSFTVSQSANFVWALGCQRAECAQAKFRPVKSGAKVESCQARARPSQNSVHLFYGSCERVSVWEGLWCDFPFIRREDERFPIDELQPLYRASAQRYDEAARQDDEHSGSAPNKLHFFSPPKWIRIQSAD